jgi:CPA1 family monovalent cation:H+ antiporter
VELGGQALAATRIQRTAVWDTVQFTLNGVMFVLLGEQLPDILRGASESLEQSGHLNPWWLVLYAFAISFGLIALRFVWVWATLRVTLYRRAWRARGSATAGKPHWRLLLATALAGARGAITLAGVLTLPLAMPDGQPFPARDLTILLASSVILISLLAASIGLPRLLGGMHFPEEPAERQQEDMARRQAASAAIAAIERAELALADGHHPDLLPQAAARVIALYEHRLNVAWSAEDQSKEHFRQLDRAERELAWPPCRPNARPSSSWRATTIFPTRRRASWCAKSILSKRATRKNEPARHSFAGCRLAAVLVPDGRHGRAGLPAA